MGIARDSTTYWLSQVANLVTSILTSIVVAVYLGPELRGLFVAVLLANALVVNLTSLGLYTTASYFIARDPSNLARQHTLFAALIGFILLLDALLALILGPRLFSGVWREVPPAELTFALLAVPFTLYLLAAQGLLVGLGRVRGLSRYLFYFSFAQSIASVVGLVFFDWRVRGLLWVWLVAQAGGAVALAAMLRASGSLWVRMAPHEILTESRRMLSYGLRAFIGSVAATVVQRFDQVFVMSARGNAGIGIYSLAARLAELIFQPAAALETAGYAQMRTASPKEAARLARELFRTTFLINGAAVAVLIVIARPLVVLAYTEEFAAAVLPLQILLPGTLMQSCSRMLSLYFSAARGRPQVPSVVAWIAAILYMVAIWWAVIHQGWALVGAAAVTSASYGLILVGLLGWFMAQTGLWNPLPYFFPQRRDLERLRRLLASRIAPRAKDSLR